MSSVDSKELKGGHAPAGRLFVKGTVCNNKFVFLRIRKSCVECFSFLLLISFSKGRRNEDYKQDTPSTSSKSRRESRGQKVYGRRTN